VSSGIIHYEIPNCINTEPAHSTSASVLFAQDEVAASLDFPNKSQTSDALAAVYSNKQRRNKPQTSKTLVAGQDLQTTDDLQRRNAGAATALLGICSCRNSLNPH
jgi:hypothetical protein